MTTPTPPAQDGERERLALLLGASAVPSHRWAAAMLRADATQSAELAALRAQVEGLRAHVADAIQIIDKHVEQFACGVGQDSDRRAWPIRDEYLHNMRAALAPPQPVAKEK